MRDIKSERRHKSVATPRAVAMYISRHHTKDSYPGVGFGKTHLLHSIGHQQLAERAHASCT